MEINDFVKAVVSDLAQFNVKSVEFDLAVNADNGTTNRVKFAVTIGESDAK